MTWHWYIGKRDELLLDLDSDRAVVLALDRLRLNLRRGLLKLKEQPYLQESHRPGHYHLMLRLHKPMPTVERIAWEIQLRSDVTRALYALMRTAHGLTCGDVLIADREYEDFRKPDRTCECKAKHKADRITGSCPVMRSLYGDEASAEYFARRRKQEQKGLRFGRIPLNRIINS